jgi:hypothetical protein
MAASRCATALPRVATVWARRDGVGVDCRSQDAALSPLPLRMPLAPQSKPSAKSASWCARASPLVTTRFPLPHTTVQRFSLLRHPHPPSAAVSPPAASVARCGVCRVLVQNGKPLVVKFAEGLRQRMEHRLLVSNLPLDFSHEAAMILFGEHGDVKELLLAPGHADDGLPQGAAFVRYSKRSEAAAVITALDGHAGLPNAERPLAIKFAEGRVAEGDASPLGAAVANGGTNGGANGGTATAAAPTSPMAPPSGGACASAALAQAGAPMAAATAPPGSGGLAPAQGGAAGASAAGAAGAAGATGAAGAAGAAAGGPGGQATGHKLFVGMIPYATTEAELQTLFVQFGPLTEVFMMREKDGRSKGCAFVRYQTKAAADAACVSLNGTLALPGGVRRSSELKGEGCEKHACHADTCERAVRRLMRASHGGCTLDTVCAVPCLALRPQRHGIWW